MAKKNPRAPARTLPPAASDGGAGVPVEKTVPPKLRDAISIALVVHLTIVIVCLTSAWVPSPLQLRLLGLFAPYSVPLGLNLQQRPIYLTRGQETDLPHRVRLTAADGTVVEEVPNLGSWVGERQRRREAIASLPVRLHAADNTEAAAALSASLAAKLVPDAEPGAAYRLQVVRSVPRGNAAVFPPPMVEDVAYEAAVVVDAEGRMQVTSLEETSQNAVPVGSSAGTEGPADAG